MSQIVAATDLSSRSQRALRRAGRLARQIAAEITLVHVVDDDQPQEMIALESHEANKFMNEQITSLAELRDVRCRVVVATGEAFEGILRTAKDTSADLIVMGTHRKQLLRDVFIGTTIERVIRTGPYPVLMVNTDAAHPYHHVLASVDMSEPSVHALKTAKALSLTADASVTVLHAFDAAARGKMYVAGAAAKQIEDYIAEERLQASTDLSTYLAAHDARDAAWSYRYEEGGAFEVIARVVKEIDPDLLVIGTHGRSGIAKMLIGSVAENVLRSLDVDILAVPPGR